MEIPPSFRSYFVRALIAVLLILCRPGVGSCTLIIEYTLNPTDARIAFEKTLKNPKAVLIRTYTKSPDAHEWRSYPFLGELFGFQNKPYGKQREVQEAAGSKTISISNGMKYDLIEILPHDIYAKLVFSRNQQIVDRYLLSPDLPVHDISEVFSSPSEIFKENDRFYLLEGSEPFLMAISELRPGTFLLYRNTRPFAEIVLNDQGLVESIDFSPHGKSPLDHYSVTLSGSHKTRSCIGKTTVSFTPAQFKKLLEDPAQWKEDQPRRFKKTDGQFRYLTRRTDYYDITGHVQGALRGRLLNAGVITSTEGFAHLMVNYDTDSSVFSEDISKKCVLTYFTNDPAIIGAKRQIRDDHIGVKFRNPLKWGITDGHYLYVHIGFAYTRHRTCESRYAVEDQFRAKWRYKPDYYEHARSGEKIRVSGFERRPLWFDKKRTLSFSIKDYWKRLSRKLLRRNNRIAGRIYARFDDAKGEVVLKYKKAEPAADSGEVLFDLKLAFQEKYGVIPGRFMMREVPKGVEIKGRLSAAQRQKLTLNDIKRIVKSKFPRPFECTDEQWHIIRNDSHYRAEVQCDLDLPLKITSITELISSHYQILDGPECKLKGPTDLTCSFWGFEKE